MNLLILTTENCNLQRKFQEMERQEITQLICPCNNLLQAKTLFLDMSYQFKKMKLKTKEDFRIFQS